jgi:hypothetical protein
MTARLMTAAPSDLEHLRAGRQELADDLELGGANPLAERCHGAMIVTRESKPHPRWWLHDCEPPWQRRHVAMIVTSDYSPSE